MGFCILLLILSARNPGQRFAPVGVHGQTVFVSNGTDSMFQLEHRLLVAGTDTVRLNGMVLDSGYLVDRRSGTVTLAAVPPAACTVLVTYRYVPFSALPAHRLHNPEQAEPVDSTHQDIPDTESRATGNQQAEQGEVALTGMKSLGVTVGGPAGSGINQSTRLSVTGTLEGISIEAEISDQSSGIPAEGTTKEIDELDRIAVRLKGKGWQGGFGDVDLGLGAPGLGRIERRAVGATVTFESGPANVELGYARPRGRFGHVALAGRDGVQGPYVLSLDGRSAQVVAASERVYLDGTRMTRGWDEDYTIDYSTGEVVFTSRRLISAFSRIEAFFQYVAEAYERSDLVASATATAGLVEFRAGAFREGDDPSRMRENELTEKERAYLAGIGADTSRAWLDGAVFVGMGNGAYVKDSAGFYRYVGEKSGDQQVAFTLVGDSLGDYVYDDTLFAFRYVGWCAGDYVAKRRVILPGREELVVAGVRASGSGFRAGVNGLFRRRMLNLFSPGGAAGQNGAVVAEAGWQGKGVGVTYSGRLQEEGFALSGQDSVLDFGYRWAGASKDSVRSVNEVLIETRPSEDLSVLAEAGILDRLNAAAVRRLRANARFGWAWAEAAKIGPESRYEWAIGPRVWKLAPTLGLSLQARPDRELRKAGVGVNVRPLDGLSAGLKYQYDDAADTTSGERTRKETGGLAQVDADWRLRDAAALGGRIVRQSRQYLVEPGRNWTQWLGNVTGSANPLAGTRVSADFSQSYRQVQLRDEAFRYVGPGNGAFARDPVTGRYYPDPNGDYERVLVAKGRFVSCREQSLVSALETSSWRPVSLSGSFSLRSMADTLPLQELGSHSMRVVLRQLEPVLTATVGGAGNRSLDLTLAATGKQTNGQEYYLELESSLLPQVDARLKAANVRNIRWLSGGALDYIEQGWKFELEPVLRSGFDLEIEARFDWLEMEAPASYPELGRFRFRSEGLVLSRSFSVGQKARVRGTAGIVHNTASVSELPYEVSLTRPIGLVPSAGLEASQMLSSILTTSLQYHFENRPDRSADHRLSAEVRAYF